MKAVLPKRRHRRLAGGVASNYLRRGRSFADYAGSLDASGSAVAWACWAERYAGAHLERTQASTLSQRHRRLRWPL